MTALSCRVGHRRLSGNNAALLEEPGDVVAQNTVHLADHGLVELGELGNVARLHQRLAKLLQMGKVAPGQRVAARAVAELAVEPLDELLLLLLLAPPGHGHLLAQVVDDVRVHFDRPGALHELVDPPERRVAREGGQVLEEIVLFLLQQRRVRPVLETQGPLPEAPDVDAAHLGRVEHLAELPHERAVHPHELLRRDEVRLVQQNPHLVLVRPEQVEDGPEFVRDVQFVRVEQNHDHVRPVRKPIHHLHKVIVAAAALLLAAQHPGRVDQRHVLQEARAGHLGPFELG
mmetsp:Transcript_28876/g.64573  ORF Transcript_28876/g.64573 Transcript_28876/m.64573 type:complete len:288 (+) Transcript_28876:316-1179(+)